VFAVGSAVDLAWVSQRTLWQDESASIIAATRSWAALAELVRHIDIVHAAYYALLHLWFDLVGYSPVSLRAMSAMGAAAAAGLMVPLGARLIGLRYGVIAAGVFLATPVVLLSATNGRSQSIEMLAAVATTLLLAVAIDHTGTRPIWRPIVAWSGYALVAYAGILIDLWILFVVAGHAVTLLVVWLHRGRAGVRVFLTGAIVIGVIAAATVPLALLAASQSGQIRWVRPPTLASGFVTLFRDTSFSVLLVQGNPLWATFAAVISWSFAIIGVIWLARRHRWTLALLLPWFAVPALGLIVVTVVVSPTFNDRYLAMIVPGVAMLVAAGLESLSIRIWWIASLAGMASLLVVAGYSWSVVRWGIPVTTDYSSVANRIHEQHVADPRARAGIIYSNVLYEPTQLHVNYPADLAGVEDLTRTPPPRADEFWSQPGGAGAAVGRAASVDIVWYIGLPKSPETPLVTGALRGRGFVLAETNSYKGVVLVEFRRAG
jgi:mannosyltransferase